MICKCHRNASLLTITCSKANHTNLTIPKLQIFEISCLKVQIYDCRRYMSYMKHKSFESVSSIDCSFLLNTLNSLASLLVSTENMVYWTWIRFKKLLNAATTSNQFWKMSFQWTEIFAVLKNQTSYEIAHYIYCLGRKSVPRNRDKKLFLYQTDVLDWRKSKEKLWKFAVAAV